MMELKEWLFRNDMSITEMSKRLHCARPYLSHIKNKKMKPSLRLAQHIQDLTNGEVTTEELLKL